MDQTVHATTLSDPVAGSHVIRMDVVPEPGVLGLAGREKAALALGRLIQPL
jgi:hypothetical protein